MSIAPTRPMTESPLAFAREALAAARAAVDPYASKFSKRDYTRHQHLAVLALKQFLKTGYRGVVAYLRDRADLRGALGLTRVPHFTTVQKATARLKKRPRRPPDRHPGPAPADPGGGRCHRVRRPPGQPLLRPGPRPPHPPGALAEADRGDRRPDPPDPRRVRHPRAPAGRPQLVPAVRRAVEHTRIDALLADAGYDAEKNHATCRGKLGIRSTVIAPNWRGSRKWPKAKYRRQMVKRFRKRPRGARSRRVYAQRWQIESGFSRNKRLLGSALRATRWVNQKKELLLRTITHNLMLLAAL